MRSYSNLVVIVGLAAHMQVAAQEPIVPYNTTIERLLTSQNFGQCMFEPTIGPDQVGMNCPNQWVTVDCGASLPGASKTLNMQKWDTIQLAYATGKEVRVRIDPNVDISGWCWLEQLQTCPSGGCPEPQPTVTPE